MLARGLTRFTSPMLGNLRFNLQRAMSSEGSKAPILFETRDHVRWITLNRPKKYNSISVGMYGEIIDVMSEAAENPDIRFLVFTGNGDYYSAGNDLNNFMVGLAEADGDMEKALDNGITLFNRFVTSFIDFPKPIIGAVNGPAFGIMVTTLALMDTVIASDTAAFTTPFTSLGQSPEGCSTYTFPLIFGPSVASKMLYFNYRLPAAEAHQRGFVSELLPKEKLLPRLEEMLYGEKGLVKTCYPNAMVNAKSLVRNAEMKKLLHQINDVEAEALKQSFRSEECQQALEKFFSRK